MWQIKCRRVGVLEGKEKAEKDENMGAVRKRERGNSVESGIQGYGQLFPPMEGTQVCFKL